MIMTTKWRKFWLCRAQNLATFELLCHTYTRPTGCGKKSSPL